MRNHEQIIRDAGADKVSSVTGAPITTVRSWIGRASIPPKHWKALINSGLADGGELIEAAAA